jgi:hypothetical protein
MGEDVVDRASVTIARTDPSDVGHRQIFARIDDGATVALMAGESRTLDVPLGAHTLYANNTLFWKKMPFEIAAGDHLRFDVINVAGRMSFGFLMGLGLAPMYLKIVRRG